MNETEVILTLKKQNNISKVEGTRVTFSANKCFAFDDNLDDIACLKAIGLHLKTKKDLALIGSKMFIDYLLKYNSDLEQQLVSTIYTTNSNTDKQHGLAYVKLGLLPTDIKIQTIFLCETLMFPCMEIKRQISDSIEIIDSSILVDISPDVIPHRAWTPTQYNIYPIEIPNIELNSDLDLAIIDCPSRNLSLMPNGLGYLDNALKKTSVSYQILDLDIISYHRYHIHRLFDMGGSITLPGDLHLPEDPWQAEHYDLWTAAGGGASGSTGRNEVLEFFRPVIDEAIEALVKAKPRVLGLSIQGCNEAAAKEIAVGVKARLPNIIIVVGGFSCYNPDIGRRAFPECDYMCIGEADLTIGPLMDALASGKQPKNQPGIISRFDTPGFPYIPAPMIHDLDTIEFPKYEWCDLSVYRNFNDYQLTPIIASRGCRWSRCTFCAERFYWRIRTPENFVDELEWLVDKGCYLYMFNESDLGGMPERVMEICDEIIRRGLHNKVKLTGQLRVNKKQNRAFYQKLRDANFVALRFGIDAFSENTLRLQKKGYTVDMISQNLKDCWEVGIFTEINWVIGVPGETDNDVTEGIQLVLKNKDYIGRLANVNPLILVNGSVYWIDPKAHNIVFKESQEEIYKKYPRALPADQWHSTKPFIDAQVRKERFERIVISLDDAGFEVGAWAQRIIDDVKYSRDRARTGAPKGDKGESFGEFEVAGGADREGLEHQDDEIEVGLSKNTSEKQINVIVTENTDEDSKPLAAPPLFGVVGKSPELVRQLESHRIVFYNGCYYGIPNAITDVDLESTDPSTLSGIIKNTNEKDIILTIEESERWANSRGQYDDQKKQKDGGSYMQANSIGLANVDNDMPVNFKILKYGELYFAVDPLILNDVFNLRTRSVLAMNKSKNVIQRIFKISRHPLSALVKIKSYVKYKLDSMKKLGHGNHATENHNNAGNAPLEFNIPGEDFSIISVTTKNAQPELMCTIGNYNVVKFDTYFYALPHGTFVDWESGTISSLPGVVFGEKLNDVVSEIEIKADIKTIGINSTSSINDSSTEEFSKTPTLLEEMHEEGYNIVSYEGWVYGMPHELGNIDLTEVDVMQMPGVIRDVSRDAVETEILELTSHTNIELSA